MVCGGRHKRRPCAICGRPSTLQCDYPAGAGRTCDAYLCRLCAVPQGNDVDWCKSHEHGSGTAAGGRAVMPVRQGMGF